MIPSFFSCAEKESTLFELLEGEETGVTFSNDLPYTEEFNTYTYRNFYNGGGVALGDINNDGLLDIYLTGNIVDSKLYLNEGNWKFKDITESAGVSCKGVWSTGASMVDVNGDGLLDIYVCKAGKPGGEHRYNELFINQGDLTFSEKSKEYGLDVTGLSIHSAFFDYDKDGDLDCYLLNNSIRTVGGFDLKEGLRNTADPEGNKLFRNDDGFFNDVTTEAGLYSSNIGYGLGITLSDFNLDNWPDIFISNDFFERDYLYINNQDGTFTERGDTSFISMSMGSMGADACDIDNDLRPDLFVTEMLPHTLERKKTKAQYESWTKYSASVKSGYHHQYPRNVLQRNIGKTQFVEVGRMSGVAATEWSWASLIQDFDNDGMKDLFVSNGIYKDLLDKDYLNFTANDMIIRSKMKEEGQFITDLIDSIPSLPVKNNMYKNIGDFVFENVSDQWGLHHETFSNGSAYGDLDNDGDLDLVINNANMPSFIYKNNIDSADHHSIQFKLIGGLKNTKAIGAKVIIKHREGEAMLENFTSKGFESTVDDKIHFGLGSIEKVDSITIIWPNDKVSILTGLAANQLYEISQEDAIYSYNEVAKPGTDLNEYESIEYKHKDVNINLFARERLLIEMKAFEGPALAVGDVNGDGIEDLFCGGGKNQSSVIFISQEEGKHYEKISLPFAKEIRSETVAAEFFDSDNDGDLDLLVGHGGKSFSVFASELNDVLYINDGNGGFLIKDDAFNFEYPIHTGDIAIADYNNDGYLDIVLGERMRNDLYGPPGSILVFKNNGENNFNQEKYDELEGIGLVTAVEMIDVNNDSWPDLIYTGEWMPVSIVLNDEGRFNTSSGINNIPDSRGLWNSISSYDLDQDGDQDLVCGNMGLNNFYKPGMQLLINDFDNNGTAEQIVCEEIDNSLYPIHDLDEMFSQMPILKKKYTFYNEFAKASISDLFDKESIDQALKLRIDELNSMVFINEGNTFSKKILPKEIQYSSVNSFLILTDKNEQIQIICGGNNYQVKPQFGKQDASFGWQFSVNAEEKHSFNPVQPLFINGQIRDIEKWNDKIVFGINNDSIRIKDLLYE